MLHHSGNYDYILDKIAAPGQKPGARILDFGCGTGAIVAMGLARGLDIRGADTFADIYEGWQASVPAEARGAVHKIEAGRLPFADGAFDVVVSNQVFEHIADPAPALAEIARVLAPGGRFLAMFPVAETWYEGHAKLYFAHWLAGAPALQSAYVSAMLKLGFGNCDGGVGAETAARSLLRILRENCVNHRRRGIFAVWEKTLGAKPQSIAGDLLRARLAHRGGALAALPGALDPLLGFISRARLGEALLVMKNG